MQEMRFEKHNTNHTNKIKEHSKAFVKEEEFSGGTFGSVFKTSFEWKSENKKPHRREFVVKKYYVAKQAIRAFENYRAAQDAGLKVFKTFRLNREEGEILMTNGNNADFHCIGSNSDTTLKKLEVPLINKLENFDSFLELYFAEAKKATDNDILVHGDAPFFFVSKSEPRKIDFVLGDLDLVDKKRAQLRNLTSAKLLIENQYNLEQALVDFIYKNMAQDKVDETLQILSQKINKLNNEQS
jgi:hypothetical protein